MSTKTNIAWCDSTINFWTGCTKVSPGCANCYAEAMDKRHLIKKVNHWGKGSPRLKGNGAVKMAMALNRKSWVCDECGDGQAIIGSVAGVGHCAVCDKARTFHRRRIFSLSRGDWLDEEVRIELLAEMLETIRRCDQVIWILCTKRPELWLSRIQSALWEVEGLKPDDDGDSEDLPGTDTGRMLNDWIGGTAPKNVIMLASVENQKTADKRIPELLKIPAVCRGLSVEPMLEKIDLRYGAFNGADSIQSLEGIDWVIFGGESGDRARPCNLDWIRDGVKQCQAAGVAAFVKQLGSLPICERKEMAYESFKAGYRDAGSVLNPILTDKKGGDMAEWPTELKIREFPKLTSQAF